MTSTFTGVPRQAEPSQDLSRARAPPTCNFFVAIATFEFLFFIYINLKMNRPGCSFMYNNVSRKEGHDHFVDERKRELQPTFKTWQIS